MSAQPQLSFNPDRPIESSEQDRLGRTDFARQLAERICAWQGQESLVIALYGDWGSGKSSVKNLIVEQLGRDQDSAPVVVEFNPWLVSGEEKITQTFFEEVGKKLEDFRNDPTTEARVVSWKKYARVLGAASQFAGAFDLISPALGIVAPGAGAWAARRLNKAKEMTDTAADSLARSSLSLQEVKQELRGHFREIKTPLLVIIDDIDRLTTDEICLVFRLVKANADFPNIIYLLPFQREMAEKALDSISNNRGREFLQKIVQVGFDLPTPTRSDLNEVLFQNIDEIIAPAIRREEWQSERWTNLWVGGLSAFFTSLRETYRFLNSFTFLFSAFRREGVLEVNPVDLIAVECLRVFEPEIYAEIRAEKDLVTGVFEDNRKDDLKILGERLLGLVRYSKDDLMEILPRLFPVLENLWGGSNYGSDFLRSWASQRRICSPDFFDRYFAFRLPPGEVSESVIRQIKESRQDRQKLGEIFRRLEVKDLLMATIERLEAEEFFDKLKDPIPYLLALTDFTDRLPRKRVRMISQYGWLLVRYAVNRVLKRTPDVNRKTEIIRTLIVESNAVSLPCQWIDDVAEPKENSFYPRLEVDDLKELKNDWLERVRRTARESGLLAVTELRWVLPRWLEWGDPMEVKEWVHGLLENNVSAVKFMNAFISDSTSQSFGSAYIRDLGWISWKGLSRFADKNVWESASTRLSSLKNPPEGAERPIRLLAEAVKRWNAGIDDENPRNFEDLEGDDEVV